MPGMMEAQINVAGNPMTVMVPDSTKGKLEVVGRFDFVTLISDKTRNFVPLFDATLTALLIPNLKVESPGILFNREKIDMLALLNQRATEEKPPTPPSATG